jgi:hypothetical protein
VNELPNGKLLLIRLAIGLAVMGVMGKLMGLIGIVFAAPILGIAIAKPLVEVMHEGFTWTANQPLRKWQGRYYEFGGVQIRVLEHKGALWFASDDVISSTGIPAAGRTLLESTSIPVDDAGELAFLDIGSLETVLLRHRSPEATRFLLWAQRDVVAPHERRKSGALVPR